MFLRHFAVALGAKKAAPKASLGALVFGAQLADLLWPIFLLLGWEQVRIDPSATRVTPLDFISYPYSHSLLAELLWGLGIGLAYFAIRRNARAAIAVALCVPSHWLLDYFSHRPDMPIVPGGPRYGLGLWNFPAATLAVELTLFAIGIALYLNATRAKDCIGHWALWLLLILLLAPYLASSNTPPPDERGLAYTALALWITVPWAAWADAHRSARSVNPRYPAAIC
ncbi:MAG TPA: hypothetical protein VMH05_22675 [Bryobacteraceae bacterium]|nr:hypothetical protein [Bryobacteraceae bacterium]